MKSVSNAVGITLRARRRLLGMSQAEVAVATGKTQPQIARMEAGVGDARLSGLVQVSRSLGVELVAVPIQLLPAVRHLIAEYEQDGSVGKRGRLVGNDPEDAKDAEADDGF